MVYLNYLTFLPNLNVLSFDEVFVLMNRLSNLISVAVNF